MSKKTMKEELKEMEERFVFFPNLAKSFCNLERELRYFNRYEWENGIIKEDLVKERETYLNVLKNLDLWDLRILFYVHHIRGWIPQQFVKVLQTQYRSQCDLLNLLHKTDVYVDPIGVFHSGKFKRNTKK